MHLTGYALVLAQLVSRHAVLYYLQGTHEHAMIEVDKAGTCLYCVTVPIQIEDKKNLTYKFFLELCAMGRGVNPASRNSHR